jgi:MFS family permease
MFGVGLSALGPYLIKDHPGTIFTDIDMQETWKQSVATALTLLGAMISALLTSIPTAKLGYKKMLILNSTLWITGGGLCGIKNLYTLLVGRFIVGISVGFSSTLAPVLLSEISHNNNRGIVTSMHQVSITFGIFCMGLLSWWMLGIEHGWWWVNSALFITMGTIMVFSGFFLPESPTWLLKNNREDEALEALRSLRKDFDYVGANSQAARVQSNDKTPLLLASGESNLSDDPEQYQQRPHMVGLTSGLDGYDIDHLQNSDKSSHELNLNIEFEQLKNQIGKADTKNPPQNIQNLSKSDSEELTWSKIFTKRYSRQIILGTGLMLSSALVGINAVTMFTTKIFGFAGLEGDNAIYGTIGSGTACFLSSFISMLTIERLGRKTLFLCGAVGCLVSLIGLSLVLLLLNDPEQKSLQGILAVIGVIGYILSFNFGLGGVPWALLPEITASKIRAKLQSLFCFQNWLGNFIIVVSTLPLVHLLGGGDSAEQEKKGAAILFLLYAFFAVFALLFGAFVLIETKGLTEPQIQLKLGNDESQGIGLDDSIYATGGSYIE